MIDRRSQSPKKSFPAKEVITGYAWRAGFPNTPEAGHTQNLAQTGVHGLAQWVTNPTTHWRQGYGTVLQNFWSRD